MGKMSESVFRARPGTQPLI